MSESCRFLPPLLTRGLVGLLYPQRRQEQVEAVNMTTKSRTADTTDKGLIKIAANGGDAVAELVRRFPEFIVRDLYRGFVASIDTADGDTEFTADPNHARIFRGAEWVQFWCRDGVDFWRSAEQVRRNAIPAINPR